LEFEICEPKFVFLTAFLTPAFKKHLAKFGVNDIYEKPIKREELYDIFVAND
jgi:hypothetical protein